VDAIADYILENYGGKVVEVCVGNYFKVAERIAEKLDVVCVDWRRPVKKTKLKFIVDDVMDPNLSIYENSELIYSLRPPLELYYYIVKISKAVKADCLIRPFGNEFSNDGKLVNYKGERFYMWFNRVLKTNKY